MSRRRTPPASLPPIHLSRRSTLAMLSSTAVLAACGGGGGGGSPTPTPAPGPAPAPAPAPAPGPPWFGYGRDAQHTAASAIASQDLGRVAWSSAVDLAPQYTQSGALLTHYGSPVISSMNTVLVPVKAAAQGTFRFEARNGANGALLWSADSDYIVPPHHWFPSFNLTLTANSRVYAPGSGGKVYFRDNVDSARAHEKRFGSTYPSIDDPSGETLLQLRGTLNPRAVPSTLVLDRQGRMAARVLGQVRASTLRALVSDALGERPA